jgi:hypothetical protein
MHPDLKGLRILATLPGLFLAVHGGVRMGRLLESNWPGSVFCSG